jgi:hypothetical protein
MQGVYNGTVTQQVINANNQDFGKNIDAMFSQLFGGSVLLRFIIGLILLLAMTIWINKEYNVMQNPLLTVIIFSIFLVIFTFIGLISKWVIYSIVIIAIAVAFIGYVIKFRTTTG